MVQSVRSKCQSSQKLKGQDHGNRGTPRRLTEQSSVSQDCVCDAQITEASGIQRHNGKTGKRVECTLDTQRAVKYMKDVQSPGKLDHNKVPVQTYCLHQNLEVWSPPSAGGG